MKTAIKRALVAGRCAVSIDARHLQMAREGPDANSDTCWPSSGGKRCLGLLVARLPVR